MASSLLRDLSLAISLMNNDPSAADGRLAWSDYAWVEPGFFECLDLTAQGACHAVHQKWDWKRNQWVDLTYGVNAARRELSIALTLTNKDGSDSDDVCVTALFVDAAGADLFVFHQNWHIGGGETLAKSFAYTVPDAVWQNTARVVVGSKQCRGGPHEDDALFASVKAQIGQR